MAEAATIPVDRPWLDSEANRSGQPAAGARPAGGEVGGSSRADQQNRPGEAAVRAGHARQAATARPHPATGRRIRRALQRQRAYPAGQRGDGRGLRPGSAGAAAAGSHRHRHPGQYRQHGLCRARRRAGKDPGSLQGQQPPDAHHRQDRLQGGAPGRRILTHGRRALAGRLARKCHHPAAGHRWADPVDSPLRHRSADRRRSALLSAR